MLINKKQVLIEKFRRAQTFFLEHVTLIAWSILIIRSFLKEYMHPFPPVDWGSYVEQMEQVLNGELDYGNITSTNGPLCYPAGHVYHFFLIYKLSFDGKIENARFFFLIWYWFLIWVEFKIYDLILPQKDRWIKILLVLSKHPIKSCIAIIFNDIFAMTHMYLCIFFLLSRRYGCATLFFAIALSTKTNILLFFPGFIYVLNHFRGSLYMVSQVFLIVIFQIIIGLPFILRNATNYFLICFDFNRTFLYSETSNWQFIPENIFSSPIFHKTLMITHLVLLVCFLFLKWERHNSIGAFLKSMRLLEWHWKVEERHLNPNYCARVIFLCNLIGVLCFRSLHNQYVLWFFGSLPFLIWQTRLRTFSKILYMFAFSYCWTYNRTALKSIGFVLYVAVLLGLNALYDRPVEKLALEDEKTKNKEK